MFHLGSTTSSRDELTNRQRSHHHAARRNTQSVVLKLPVSRSAPRTNQYRSDGSKFSTLSQQEPHHQHRDGISSSRARQRGTGKLTFALFFFKLGRLTHYAFDAVILSAFLAGVRRSTGLTYVPRFLYSQHIPTPPTTILAARDPTPLAPRIPPRTHKEQDQNTN